MHVRQGFDVRNGVQGVEGGDVVGSWACVAAWAVVGVDDCVEGCGRVCAGLGEEGVPGGGEGVDVEGEEDEGVDHFYCWMDCLFMWI